MNLSIFLREQKINDYSLKAQRSQKSRKNFDNFIFVNK